MTCRVFTDLIADYLAADLEPERRHAFLDHYDACPECRMYLRSYETTVTLARHAFDDDTRLPAPVRDKVIRAVLRVRLRRTDR